MFMNDLKELGGVHLAKEQGPCLRPSPTDASQNLVFSLAIR